MYDLEIGGEGAGLYPQAADIVTRELTSADGADTGARPGRLARGRRAA